MSHTRVLIKNQQCGFSLVGIMIGLLLAMITVLASLTLYRTLSQTSVDSRIDAALDGQIASAMLTLQLEIQSAGFGYEPGASLHVFLEPGTSPSYIYWRYYDIGLAADTCRGFRVEDTNSTTRQLQLLKPSTCNETSALSSLTWSDATNILSVLAEFKVRDGQSLPEVILGMDTVSCFPYGMSAIEEHPQVIISLDNAARRAALDDASLTTPNNAFRYTFCLSNIGNI